MPTGYTYAGSALKGQIIGGLAPMELDFSSGRIGAARTAHCGEAVLCVAGSAANPGMSDTRSFFALPAKRYQAALIYRYQPSKKSR